MTEFKKKLAGVFRLLPNRMQTPKVQQRWWDGSVSDEGGWTSAHPSLSAFRWRDHNPEDFVDEPDFLDRLTAARSARDPEFPARVAAARARLVAESTELSNKMLSARIHELYDENKELKATIVRAQKAAHEPVDGAERIRELEGEQEKALLRRRMLEREIDDLDEYCELLERFASKKAKGKAQRKFDKRRRDKAASGFAPGQKLIVGPNTVTFTGAEFAEGCADAEGFPPLIPNDDADRAENEMHNLDSQGKMP